MNGAQFLSTSLNHDIITVAALLSAAVVNKLELFKES